MLKGNCLKMQKKLVINVTKHIMKKNNMTHEEAYKDFLTSETYKILMNSDSGLYLESDDYLIKAMDIEFNDGKESLYSFLSNN